MIKRILSTLILTSALFAQQVTVSIPESTNTPNSPSSSTAITPISNLATGGDIGTASETIDVSSAFVLTQTTAGQTITLPAPTSVTGVRFVSFLNSSASTTNVIIYGVTLVPGQATGVLWDGSAWRSADVAGGTANVLSETGTIYPSADVSVAPAVNTPALALTFITVPLPSAGVWKITPQILMNAGNDGGLVFGLFDSTGTLVANSATIVARTSAALALNTISLYTTGTAEYFVTTTVAATYTIRVWAAGNVTATATADTYGKSRVTYMKVAGFVPYVGQSTVAVSLYCQSSCSSDATSGSGQANVFSLNTFAILKNSGFTVGANQIAVLTTGAYDISLSFQDGADAGNGTIYRNGVALAGVSQFSAPDSKIPSVQRIITDLSAGDILTFTDGYGILNNIRNVHINVIQIGGAATNILSGATASVAGSAGYVPQPSAGQQNQVLRGDATFGSNVPNFSGTVNYSIGDVVISAGSLWQSLTTHAASVTLPAADATNWVQIGSSGGATMEYVHVGSATLNQSTTAGAVVIFPTILSGTIPYNTTNGQFTLTAGKTYRLEGSPTGGSVYWYNVTGSVALSEDSSGAAFGSNANIEAVAYFTPTVNSIVVLMSNTGGGSTSANGTGGASFTARVEQIGGPATTQFGAATAATAGQSGFVPAPDAGKQNQVLRGDSTFGSNVPLFTASTAYAIGDVVADASTSSIYRAIVAHTAAASFTADTPAVNWAILSGNGQVVTDAAAGGVLALTVPKDTKRVILNPTATYTSCTITLGTNSTIDGTTVAIYMGDSTNANQTICPTLSIVGGAGTNIVTTITPTIGKGGDTFQFQYDSFTTDWRRIF